MQHKQPGALGIVASEYEGPADKWFDDITDGKGADTTGLGEALLQAKCAKQLADQQAEETYVCGLESALQNVIRAEESFSADSKLEEFAGQASAELQAEINNLLSLNGNSESSLTLQVTSADLTYFQLRNIASQGHDL